MTKGLPAPAEFPPAGLSELRPEWSRLITAPDHTGQDRTWHLLDSSAGEDTSSSEPRLTVLCVHGNPSWSYLWRSVLAGAPSDVRVIAVDQLDMGFSERTGVQRRLVARVDDLCALTDHLEIQGPVVTIAHDWGGPVSLGWALRHVDQLQGVVLTNTAVHQPEGSPAPSLIRAARTPGLFQATTVNSATFVHGAIELSRPRLAKGVREALLAPYRTAERRQAIGDFVEDIPLDPSHPSYAPLAAIADGLAELRDIPALLLWGPSDPVFSDLYLHDLEARLPHADVHRFVGASHFVVEDADVAGAFFAWLGEQRRPSTEPPQARTQRVPLWHELDRLHASQRPGVIEIVDGNATTASFAELSSRVDNVAVGLARHGVAKGHRVALMIEPGIELNVALYACWKIGAVIVLVDSGLGPKNMSRALKSSAPDFLIGIDRALRGAKALRWPGRRISVIPLNNLERRLLGVETSLADLEELGRGPVDNRPPLPDDDDDAAVVFTSGSTGPSKGVVYRHHQVQAQRDLLREVYEIEADDRLVAAFAPFALYGPALGITSVVPDMDITQPATLTASALGDATAAADATLVFASPAALTNVLATQGALSSAHRSAFDAVRLFLSAGAPIGEDLLRRTAEVFRNAEAHTPYGMTEVLPVADISVRGLDDKRNNPTGGGVCVGTLVPGLWTWLYPVNNLGETANDPTTDDGVLSEVMVHAAHTKDRYDRLWYTDHQSSLPGGWHRSGDIGMLDRDGLLWIAGRLEHVITTSDGPLGPVSLEQAAQSIHGVTQVAAVGVGPVGSQVVVLVIQPDQPPRKLTEATPNLREQVRAAVAAHCGPAIDVAAVLVAPTIPVDQRHNSKIDRRFIAQQASIHLAGN